MVATRRRTLKLQRIARYHLVFQYMVKLFVNSKLNDGATAERTAEASTIASACAKAIAGRSEFATIVIIHVDYVKRLGNTSTVIQGIDFNKAPDGAFRLHLT